jgi:hypothetical protein
MWRRTASGATLVETITPSRAQRPAPSWVFPRGRSKTWQNRPPAF